MRHIRVFVSSPVDVAVERQRIQRVIERLNGEFAQVARFEAIRWETEFFSADKDFQSRIARSEDCDVVIGIFWGRLGSPLPDSFERMPETMASIPGEPYPSGSGYEILSALHACGQRESRQEAARPDVYVFRKTSPPLVAVGRPDAIAEAQDQWHKLEQFWRRWFRNEHGQILRSHYYFADIDGFDQDVLALLRDWARRNVSGAASIIWPIAIKGSPFRGLDAFDAQHAPVFFGRDRKILRAIDVLKAASGWTDPASAPGDASDAIERPVSARGAEAAVDARERQPRPFLLIVGPSGAGKSSFMRAGLMPRLAAPGVVTGVDEWRSAVTRPQDRETAILSLATAIMAAVAPAELKERPAATTRLAGLLRSDPAAASRWLLDVLDRIGRDRAAEDGGQRQRLVCLAIGIDQLDEIFSADVDAAERSAFASALSELTRSRRVWAFATLRGDIYEELIADRAWLALKDAGATYDLAPPGAEEFEEIVQKSAAAAGLVYEIDPDTGRSLDRQLLADAAGEDVLPLLQFTLERLFARREERSGETVLTFAAYTAIGGLDGAIEQTAEAALAGVGAAERLALPRLLRLFAAPTVGRETLSAQAAPLAAVAADPATHQLAEALVAARVLSTAKHADGSSTLRFAHQRVIETWQRANTIIDGHRDFYRIREEVAQQHKRWIGRRQRRQFLIPPGVAIAEAEKIARDYRAELPSEILDFIRRSGARARWRWTLLRTAAAAFALLAVGAGGLAVLADRSYSVARGTIDRLLTSFAGSLTNVEGIKVATLDRSYQEIGRAVEELGRQAGVWDSTFDATRATMLYEFGRTYKKAAPAKALDFAEQSAVLRARMVAQHPGAGDAQWKLSQSFELIGDLKRQSGELDAATAHFERAAELRRGLHRRDRKQQDWLVGLIEMITRVGSLEEDAGRALARDGKRDAAAPHFAKANRFYEELLDVSMGSLFLAPDELKMQSQVTWGLNKHIDQLLRSGKTPAEFEQASDLAELSVCLRRSVLVSDPINTRWQNDVAWSLQKKGQALERLARLDEAELAFMEAFVIRRRIVDPNDKHLVNDLAAIEALLGKLHQRKGNDELALAFIATAGARIPELVATGSLASHLRRFDVDGVLAEARAKAGAGAEAILARREEIVVGAFMERQRGLTIARNDCLPDAMTRLRSFAIERAERATP